MNSQVIMLKAYAFEGIPYHSLAQINMQGWNEDTLHACGNKCTQIYSMHVQGTTPLPDQLQMGGY
jgi:hypothetical protein